MIVTACRILTLLLSTFIRVRHLAVSLICPNGEKNRFHFTPQVHIPLSDQVEYLKIFHLGHLRVDKATIFVFSFSTSQFWEFVPVLRYMLFFLAASGWRETRALVSSSTTEKESPLPWHLAKSTIHLNFSFGYIARRHQHRSAPSLRLCW